MIRALLEPAAEGKAEKHTGGRPPLGYTVEDGFLVRDDDFDAVADALQRYRDGSISKREAARRADTTRRTIERAAQRTDQYNLV